MSSNEKQIVTAIVASFALVSAGIASMDVQPTREVKVPVKVQDTKTIYKTRNVVVHDQVKKPSGYIARDKCYTIAHGTDFSDLIFRYGWPADDDANDSYAGLLLYPLAEDHGKYCEISFLSGEVDSVSVELG